MNSQSVLIETELSIAVITECVKFTVLVFDEGVISATLHIHDIAQAFDLLGLADIDCGFVSESTELASSPREDLASVSHADGMRFTAVNSDDSLSFNRSFDVPDRSCLPLLTPWLVASFLVPLGLEFCLLFRDNLRVVAELAVVLSSHGEQLSVLCYGCNVLFADRDFTEHNVF